MADIRDLQLLVSLSRHKHFSRAADDCGISQPAFSARIRKMEEGFALPLVRRGNTFLGFTREGEVVLKWARKVLADVEGMRQEIDALNIEPEWQAGGWRDPDGLAVRGQGIVAIAAAASEPVD